MRFQHDGLNSFIVKLHGIQKEHWNKMQILKTRFIFHFYVLLHSEICFLTGTRIPKIPYSVPDVLICFINIVPSVSNVFNKY